ncbi:WXG100 family type VII secretion target [Nocardia alba]|uniref:Type VII secretion system (Wss) protein ESAT-6 n=1 Tax=Nocardia alba TaxID=225051 RepID=A0A4R1G0L1_9NOCA|nr:WXG100 family type VII secretion target [Nocardia alba]TCJ99722.1 hypothetical protein DFR71_0704 [Nocardia alba]
MALRSISGRTDADYVSVVEVFDHLSHTEIHSAVRQLDPAALAGAGETFLTTATGLGDGVEIAHGEIRAAIADGWRGAAAQQASDAVRDFEQAGRRIADVLTAVGVRLCQAGDAAESLRAAIAEPDGTQPDPTAALLDSEQAANNATITREAENARLDAVRSMETIYAGAFLPTGSGVPAFTGIATETATAATVTPSGTVSSVGVAQTPAVVASTATAETVTAATTAAGSSPVVSTASTTSAGNGGLPTSATAATPGAAANGPTPTTVSAAATTTPNRPPADAGRASTPPTSTTAALGAMPVGARTRRAASARSAAVGVTPPTDQTHAANTAPGDTDTEAASEVRHERDSSVSGGEAATGMGAGAIGGMMGGAIAAADQARPSGGPRPAAPVEQDEDEEDDFLRFLEDEPTYLEPADEVNALIGKMEPTSPAVLGEWTERE